MDFAKRAMKRMEGGQSGSERMQGIVRDLAQLVPEVASFSSVFQPGTGAHAGLGSILDAMLGVQGGKNPNALETVDALLTTATAVAGKNRDVERGAAAAKIAMQIS